MPLTFIRKEKTLRELATRVFDVSPTEPEALKRAEAALEAANPGVDFRRLEPGTVLVVPERADVRPAARETAAGPIAG